MRIRAALLACLAATGCADNSYRIPRSELLRLAATPPAQRGDHVFVSQEYFASDVPNATHVEESTPLVLVPPVYIDGGEQRRNNGSFSGGSSGGGFSGGGGHVGGGGHGGGGGIGGGGGDGRAYAIVAVVAAVTILVVAAAVEGDRFDGYAKLHPMHPLHFVGQNGGELEMPLAWLDPQTAALADYAVVHPTEGTWQRLDRAPLWRTGWTYAVYSGASTYVAHDRSIGTGPGDTIQLGYFPEQHIGIVGSVFLGWRDDAMQNTLFESRYTLELQAFPVAAGPVHFGAYGGAGLAYRFEKAGNDGGGELHGGAALQLDVATRLALTLRLGVSDAHGATTQDAMFGLAVY